MIDDVIAQANLITSSYKRNNYGQMFYSLLRCINPSRCVEIGTLGGYSTIFIAAALRDNNYGHLYAYDLWDKYAYHHTLQSETQLSIDAVALQDWVDLIQKDAYSVLDDYEDNTIDFMHVDISNNGAVFDRFLVDAEYKLTTGGVLIFEGGSEKRDMVPWMKKFNKPKIQPVINGHPLIGTIYDAVVIRPYPSITICVKR